MTRKIYVDFDRTIFNTEKWYSILQTEAINAGLNKDILDNALLHEEKKDTFDFFSAVNEALIQCQIRNNEILYLTKRAGFSAGRSCVYNDVIPCLHYFRKKGLNVILLTYGNVEFQHFKISSTGILSVFSSIIITDKHKWTIDLGPSPFVVLDDNPRELEAFRESRPSCMLWEIKRKGSKYEHTRYENVDYSSNELNIDIAAQLVDRINSLC